MRSLGMGNVPICDVTGTCHEREVCMHRQEHQCLHRLGLGDSVVCHQDVVWDTFCR